MSSARPPRRAPLPEQHLSRRQLLALLAGIALQLGGCARLRGAPPPAAALEPRIAARLQQLLDTAQADAATRYPGAILHVATPRGAWTGSSGVASLGASAAPDPAAKFRCGSILKPFIATVVLQLVEERRLALDQRLAALLPADLVGLFEYSDRITLRMLLNHTSGIGEWTGATPAEEQQLYETMLRRYPRDRIWEARELLQIAAQNDPRFPPGTRWQYNNAEYNLLGLVIDRVTGRSWRDQVRHRIVAPLGLRHTLLPEPGTMTMPAPFLAGYGRFDGVLTDISALDPSMAGAAGGHALVANAADLAIFLRALLAGELFREPATLAAMLDFVDLATPDRPFRTGYGLGLARYQLPDGSLGIGHTGQTAGYRSAVFWFPEQRIAVAAAVAAHEGPGFEPFLVPALRLVSEYLRAGPP